MLITSVEKQKNNQKRYSIFIDNEFAFGLDEIDVLYYKLKENEEISEEKLKRIKESIVLSKAKDTAMRFIGYKARTKKEVTEKLKEKEFSNEITDEVIALLEKYNYINDEAFARAYIKERFNSKGYGALRISYELKHKGIADDIINEALSDMSLNEEERAVLLIKKKLAYKSIDIQNDLKEKQRLYGYLARRGFSYDTISLAFKRLRED